MRNETQNEEEQFERFMAATRKGDTAEMEASFIPDFTEKEENEETRRRPLHIAVWNQQLAAVRWLLNHNADISSKDERGWMPIHFGGMAGHIGVLEELVAHRADVNSKGGQYGRVAMHYVAMNGHCTTMTWLRDKGGDINCIDEDGWTPLHLAAARGRKKSVEWLLREGADACAQNKWHNRPIDTAALYGQTETVDLLRRMRPSVDTRVTKFVADVCAGRTDEVRRQLEEDKGDIIDVNEPVTERGSTAMHLAASNRLVEMMALLTEHGANIEAEDNGKWRPLHWACNHGHTEAVRWLVETAGCVLDSNNADGLTPMDIARRYGRKNCVIIMEDEQVRRQKEEFQIFHLSTVSIIFRKHKKYDWTHAIDAIKSNIPPISRPVVICNFVSPLRDLPSTLALYKFVSDRLAYCEYLVEDVKRNRTKLKESVLAIRNWEIEPSVLEKSKEIQLQIRNLPDQTTWNKSIVIDMDVLGEQPVKMLVADSIKGADLKISFTDFLKFEIRWKMHVAVDSKPIDNDRIIHFLQKLVLTRTWMVTFYDKNQEKLSNSKSIKECGISDGHRILVVSCTRRSVQLIPHMHRTKWTKDVVSKLVLQEYLLVLSITDDTTDMAIPWTDVTYADDVKTAIRNCVEELDKERNEGRLLLIGCNGELVGDSEIIDEVIHYAFVLPYDGNVTKIKNIGAGGFGLVYSCRIGKNGKVFAIKELSIIDGSLDNSKNGFINEVKVSAHAGCHDRIMKYHKFFESEHSFFIAMDCMKGPFSTYLKDHYPLDEEKLIFYARQILEGLKHLHERKIIHRDMKFQNVLLDENDSIKLSDFGLSRYVDAASSRLNTGGGKSQVGTERYMAPEMLDSKISVTNASGVRSSPKYGLRADIWSFGAMMVEMLTGKPPYPELNDAAASNIIRKTKRIEYECPKQYSVEVNEFVQACLHSDPLKRPSCAALLMNPVLNRVP